MYLKKTMRILRKKYAKSSIFPFTEIWSQKFRFLMLLSYFTASNAASRAAIRSSTFSIPMERRMVFGLMPWSRSSSSVHWLCVVVAGCKQGEDCQVINEFLCCLGIALNLECEDGTTAIWKVFLVQIMAWLTFQRWMMNSFYLWMF